MGFWEVVRSWVAEEVMSEEMGCCKFRFSQLSRSVGNKASLIVYNNPCA